MSQPDLTQPRTPENIEPLLRWLAAHFQPLGGKLPELPEAEREALVCLLLELAEGIERDPYEAAPCLIDPRPTGRPQMKMAQRVEAVEALATAMRELGGSATQQRIEEEAADKLGGISLDTLRRRLGKK